VQAAKTRGNRGFFFGVLQSDFAFKDTFEKIPTRHRHALHEFGEKKTFELVFDK
jgi:hypothetical protein